jgi:hypothetical protein
MKTIAGLAALVTSLTLAGCAGTLDCLRSDRDFEAYAERLNLRNLSVEDAAAVLVADGYQCEKKPPIAFEAAIACLIHPRANPIGQLVELQRSQGAAFRCMSLKTPMASGVSQEFDSRWRGDEQSDNLQAQRVLA